MQDIGKPANCVKSSTGTRYAPPVAPIVRLAAPLLLVHLRDLRSRYHDRSLAHPRQIVMWLAVELGCSYAGTGRYLRRDHATVIHACRKIDGLRHSDAELRELTDGLLALARKPRLETRRAPFVVLAPLPPPTRPNAAGGPGNARQRPCEEEDAEAHQARVAFAVQDARFRLAMLASGEVA